MQPYYGSRLRFAQDRAREGSALISAAPGTRLLSLGNGLVAAASNCTVTVDVTATAPGSHVNTDDLDSSLGTSPSAIATLTVGGGVSPLEIPAADRWALLLLGILLLGFAVLRLRLAP